MTTLTLVALSASIILYIGIAIRGKSLTLKDHIPVDSTGNANVKSAAEFSAATVATSISLATVILAYTELAGAFGGWLLWTVATTAMGLAVVRAVAPSIWDGLRSSGKALPTLHEFLGAAYGSPSLALTAATCTAFGFLGALAVELSVGSRFLASLAPAIPTAVAVAALAAAGVAYTVIGGFRMVVLTDRVQMYAIWITIATITVLIATQIWATGGWASFKVKIPASMYDFSWREGLGAFLIGVTLINIPTFVSDMSIWQRIAATSDREIVSKGLGSSILGAVTSWTSLVLLACAIAVVSTAKEGQNPLATFLTGLGQTGGVLAAIAFMAIVAGLYAASLSTASTQLLAAGHALHTDVVLAGRDKSGIGGSSAELRLSRLLLIGVAVAALVVVEALTAIGFSISDLVFAVYGAQLGMVPVVLFALLRPKSEALAVGNFAAAAVALGFAAGWVCAGYGKLTGNGDLVFLSPAASLIVSIVVFGAGLLLAKR